MRSLTRLDNEIKRISAEANWDDYRKKPGPGTYALAGLIYILPKIGPIKLTAVKGPTAETEAEYIHSVLMSNAALNSALKRFTPPPKLRPAARAKATENGAVLTSTMDDKPATAAGKGTDPRHPLANRDLDTGNAIQPAGYPLTDKTYAMLTHRLTSEPQQAIPPGVKENILSYYTNMSLPFQTKKKPAEWARLQQELTVLKAMPTTADENPFDTYDEPEPEPAKQ